MGKVERVEGRLEAALSCPCQECVSVWGWGLFPWASRQLPRLEELAAASWWA